LIGLIAAIEGIFLRNGYFGQRVWSEIGGHLRRLHEHVINEVARKEKNKQRNKI
jgi:hypothetical protein